METRERMDELRELVHLSNYAFCKRCQIPYSTLKAARNRGNQLSVATVKQVCDTFGISLSDFFSDEQLSVDIPDPNQLVLSLEDASDASLSMVATKTQSGRA